MNRHTRILLLTAFFALLAGAAWACPSCGEALSSKADPAAAKLSEGWKHSIALLMGAPYALFAGFTFYVVRSTRRSRSRRSPR